MLAHTQALLFRINQRRAQQHSRMLWPDHQLAFLLQKGVDSHSLHLHHSAEKFTIITTERQALLTVPDLLQNYTHALIHPITTYDSRLEVQSKVVLLLSKRNIAVDALGVTQFNKQPTLAITIAILNTDSHLWGLKLSNSQVVTPSNIRRRTCLLYAEFDLDAPIHHLVFYSMKLEPSYGKKLYEKELPSKAKRCYLMPKMTFPSFMDSQMKGDTLCNQFPQMIMTIPVNLSAQFEKCSLQQKGKAQIQSKRVEGVEKEGSTFSKPISKKCVILKSECSSYVINHRLDLRNEAEVFWKRSIGDYVFKFVDVPANRGYLQIRRQNVCISISKTRLQQFSDLPALRFTALEQYPSKLVLLFAESVQGNSLLKQFPFLSFKDQIAFLQLNQILHCNLIVRLGLAYIILNCSDSCDSGDLWIQFYLLAQKAELPPACMAILHDFLATNIKTLFDRIEQKIDVILENDAGGFDTFLERCLSCCQDIEELSDVLSLVLRDHRDIMVTLNKATQRLFLVYPFEMPDNSNITSMFRMSPLDFQRLILYAGAETESYECSGKCKYCQQSDQTRNGICFKGKCNLEPTIHQFQGLDGVTVLRFPSFLISQHQQYRCVCCLSTTKFYIFIEKLPSECNFMDCNFSQVSARINLNKKSYHCNFFVSFLLGTPLLTGTVFNIGPVNIAPVDMEQLQIEIWVTPSILASSVLKYLRVRFTGLALHSPKKTPTRRLSSIINLRSSCHSLENGLEQFYLKQDCWFHKECPACEWVSSHISLYRLSPSAVVALLSGCDLEVETEKEVILFLLKYIHVNEPSLQQTRALFSLVRIPQTSFQELLDMHDSRGGSILKQLIDRKIESIKGNYFSTLGSRNNESLWTFHQEDYSTGLLKYFQNKN